jgi:hypothetical protein
VESNEGAITIDATRNRWHRINLDGQIFKSIEDNYTYEFTYLGDTAIVVKEFTSQLHQTYEIFLKNGNVHQMHVLNGDGYWLHTLTYEYSNHLNTLGKINLLMGFDHATTLYEVNGKFESIFSKNLVSKKFKNGELYFENTFTLSQNRITKIVNNRYGPEESDNWTWTFNLFY